MIDQPLPPSLAAQPNLPWEMQTLAQLEAERDYWQVKIDTAPHWGAALGFACEARDACQAEIARRVFHR